jgi:hypothetical protein
MKPDMPEDIELLRSSTMTIEYYMARMTYVIDGQFGEGYTRAHPDLMAKLVRCCCMDFDTSMRVKYGRKYDESEEPGEAIHFNNIHDFIDERIVITGLISDSTPMDDTYAKYVKWCLKLGIEDIRDKDEFTLELEKAGASVELRTSDRKRLRVYSRVRYNERG